MSYRGSWWPTSVGGTRPSWQRPADACSIERAAEDVNRDGAALSVLAGPGGPLEVRRVAQPWSGAPQFAELVARLYPVEQDVLEFIDGHKVEIAPDDFSAQDVPREALLRYFGFTGDQLDAVIESLAAHHLVAARRDYLGLTTTAVQMLSSRPATSAPPRS